MGIDKPDVRYVIHYSLSQSLEAYYQVSHPPSPSTVSLDLTRSISQETGRAGRDGKTSVCVLYYAYGDTKIIHHLIDQSEGTREQKQNNKNNLSRVVQYCLNLTDCRRAQVLQYFGERFPAEKCHKTCDNCLLGNAFEQRDVTGLAKEAVQLVESIQDDKGITTAICVGILKGSKTRQVRHPFLFCQTLLSTYLLHSNYSLLMLDTIKASIMELRVNTNWATSNDYSNFFSLRIF